jgi:hypothetical protein
MKIKSDFITNSSSSSFIVVFPKKIETIDDVLKYMSKTKAEVVFRESTEQIPIKIDFEDKEINTNLIDIIYSIILEHTDKYVADEIILQIKEVMKNQCPEVFLKIPQIDYISMQLKALEEEGCDEDDIKKLIAENNKGFIYQYRYADEDGSFWGEMEHGGTFNELPHIQISHH